MTVKTPYLNFKGGEEKTVSDYQLLNPYNDVSMGGGKKYVKAERKNEALSEDDLIIQK